VYCFHYIEPVVFRCQANSEPQIFQRYVTRYFARQLGCFSVVGMTIASVLFFHSKWLEIFPALFLAQAIYLVMLLKQMREMSGLCEIGRTLLYVKYTSV